MNREETEVTSDSPSFLVIIFSRLARGNESQKLGCHEVLIGGSGSQTMVVYMKDRCLGEEFGRSGGRRCCQIVLVDSQGDT